MSNIIFSKDVLKTIKTYDNKTRERILAAIDGIPLGDIKKLKGNYLPPIFRLRVGKYRALYYMDDDGTIRIIKIDSRGDVYK